MKINKISNNEVSVYLTKQELEYFDFRMEGGVPREDSLHSFLFNVMEIVESETGFDPYNGGRIVVEAVHSRDGMKLHISRLGSNKKLTREQFRHMKSVRAKKPNHELDEVSLLAYTELMRLLRAFEKATAKEKNVNMTFMFDDFNTLEEALCRVRGDMLCDAVLYRSGARYAIVTKTSRGSRLYNTLSEFASIHRGGDILASDIGEGWNELVRGDKLREMADELKTMQ